MNTYSKFVPNVFLAKCTEEYQTGDVIEVETKYGKQNSCIVFNLIKKSDEHFFYSIVREDGFDSRTWAANRAAKLSSAANNAEKKSTQFWEASQEGADFLKLAEPIKIGHHSEKRHRALIDRNWNRMRKCVDASDKAETYEERAAYWESRANDINLSMPDSIDFYSHKLEEATKRHEGLKSGTIAKEHSYSLTYAKKAVNEAKKNFDMAVFLWEERKPKEA